MAENASSSRTVSSTSSSTNVQLTVVQQTSPAAGEVSSSTPARTSSSLSSAELQRALDRVWHGMIRGACIGLTLRGGLHLVGSLLAAVSKRKDRSLTAASAFGDTARYAAFLAALAGIYIGVDEGIAAAVGKDRSAKWRSLVAGMCAGPALLCTGPKSRHYSLATYILLRGITLLIRTGNKPRAAARHPLLHAALAPTRLAHGDTLLMCGAASQIVYAFIMMPQTLPPSYVRFIRKQGAKELYVWRGIRELAERTAAGRPTGPLSSLAASPHAASCAATPCGFFHPGQSCSGHVLSLLGPAYSRALSVYLPVYVLPALLVHRQQLLKAPLPILHKVLLGISRSSLFLSSYICLAFGGACAGHRLLGRSTGAIIAGSVWLGGLATLLEKKSRRMELALYVLSRSLESFSRCCIDWGWLSPRSVPPRLDILLFAAGVGAITHCYSGNNGRDRDVFKSKYLNVLDFVFGNTGITEGKIKHLPSNQDLLKSVGVRVVRSLSYSSLHTAALPGRKAMSCANLVSLETVVERSASMSPPLSPAAAVAAAGAFKLAAAAAAAAGGGGSSLAGAADAAAAAAGAGGSSTLVSTPKRCVSAPSIAGDGASGSGARRTISAVAGIAAAAAAKAAGAGSSSSSIGTAAGEAADTAVVTFNALSSDESARSSSESAVVVEAVEVAAVEAASEEVQLKAATAAGLAAS